MIENLQQAAEALTRLGVHLAKTPEETLHVDAVFILGSTAPNMTNRLGFAKDQVFPKIATYTGHPPLMGLTGERVLIPAKQDSTRGYLGDFAEVQIEGQHLLTRAEAEGTVSKYHKEEKPTEAGAMQLLAERILPPQWLDHWNTVNATAKPGKDRPDTEDTAYFADRLLLEKGMIPSAAFKLAVVSDAAFQGQKEQVLAGLVKAGIILQSDQVIFCGMGYPAEVFKIPAYVQIGASAIAEHAFNLQVRLELTLASQAKQNSEVQDAPCLQTFAHYTLAIPTDNSKNKENTM